MTRRSDAPRGSRPSPAIDLIEDGAEPPRGRRAALASRLAPFALAAALGLAAFALPPARDNPVALGAAAGLAALILAVSVLAPWSRLPRFLQAAPPLACLVVVATLHASQGGDSSAYPLLAVLPLLWLALYGTRAELVVALLGVVALLTAPIVLTGEPAYPYAELPRALLCVVAAGLVAAAVQRVVAATRGRFVEAARRAAALRESEERSHAIVEQAPEAFVATDESGVITDWNSASESALGWSRQEAVGRSLAETIVPARLRDADAGGAVDDRETGNWPLLEGRGEVTVRHRAGHQLTVELAVSAVRHPGGLLYNAFLHDVTDRLEVEREHAHLAAIVDSSAEAIIGEALDGTILSWNPGAERLYGYSAEEAVGRSIALIVPPDHRDDVPRTLERVSDGERVDLHDAVQVAKDGTLVHVSLAVSPIRDGSGAVVGASAIARDVTERRRRDDYLAGQNAVSRVLAEAASLDRAIPGVLEAIGTHLGWDAGAFWSPDAAGEELSCHGTWQSESIDAEAFRAGAYPMRFPLGAGLPGRVWQSAEPIWLEELQAEAARAPALAVVGLRAAVGLPVFSDSRVVAVIELYTRAPRPAEPDLIETMEQISSQIGQFFERKRAEEQLVAHAENIAAIVRTRELARVADPGAVRQAICEVTRQITGGVAAVLYEPDAAGTALAVTAAVGVELPGPASANAGPAESKVPFVGPTSEAVGAFASAQPLLLSNPPGDRSFVPGALVPSDTASFLWQPVIRDGGAMAVLAVGVAHRLRRLDERLASLLDLLASEAAVAIERADLLARLEAVARTDDLTGLPNRRSWDEELPRELSRARRDNRPVCVAMLDLDHFKAFNDRRGHQAGDRFLKHAAAAWRNELRATDVIARYGGEEFAVVLPACNIENAYALLGRLRAATPEQETCSGGMACWDGDESADALVGRADEALYEAKRAGRDRLVVARPSRQPGDGAVA